MAAADYFSQVQKIYVAYYGRPADPAGLSYWGSRLDAAGGNLSSIINAFGTSSESTALYTGTDSAKVTAIYQQLFNRAPDTAGLNFYTGELTAGRMTAASIALNVANGASGTDATYLSNKLTVASAFTDALNVDSAAAVAYAGTSAATSARSLISGVTTSAATTNVASTVSSIKSGGGAAAGQTFTLTTNADVMTPTSVVVGSATTSGDDNIYANTNDTLNSGDVIFGGAGNDTIFANLATAATLTPTLDSIERILITNTTAAGNNTFTLSGANVTGTTLVQFSASDTNIDTHVASGFGSATAFGINSSTGAAHVYTFRQTDAALSGSADTVTLNVKDATTATGAVTVTNATTSTGSNDGAETVRLVVSNTTASSTSTLGSLVVTDGTNARMNTLAISGAGNLTITGAIDFEGTASGAVDASGATGTVTLTLNNGEAITYTGGTGSDRVTLGATNDTVTGGAGNDRVTLAVASLTTGDSINLGDGTRDEIRYSDVTTLNSTGVSATQLAALNAQTGIEVVGSSGAVTAVDASYFNQTVYNLSAALTAAVTVSNVASDTLRIESGITTVNGDALTVSGALPNQTFTLELSGSAAVSLAGTDGTAGNTGLTISSGISRVNLVSSTSATTAVTNTIANAAATTATHAIDNASASSFVITGGTDLAITKGATAGFTQAVDFDASGFTGALNVDMSASADVVKGGSGNDTIEGMGGADQLTGGAGSDTFQLLSATIASGNDTITDFTVGSGGDVLDIGFLTLPTSLTTSATMTGATAIATNTIYTLNYGGAIGTTDFTVAGATGFGLLFGTGKAFGTTVVATDDFMIIVQGTDKTVVLAVENPAATTLAATDIDAVVTLTGVTSSNTFHISNIG